MSDEAGAPLGDVPKVEVPAQRQLQQEIAMAD